MTRSKNLLATLRGVKQERSALWLMRQAGRYLPEYRALRETKGGFLELCYDPEAAAEVSSLPRCREVLDLYCCRPPEVGRRNCKNVGRS